MSANDAVLFEEMPGNGGDLGIITLNCQSVLNSLTEAMILSMHAKLTAWAQAQHIKAVIIRAAEGRAFCAGGNLRAIYEKAKAHDRTATDFFRHEYQLNRSIYHFPKPYIALLDGITMGGGVGISIHGSHRVATERLMFAMPETGIGFFPDVGGSFFLPRLSGYLGYYLGLTGARLNSDDCVALKIAQHKVARAKLADLVNALAQQAFTGDAKKSVTDLINQFNLATQTSILIEQQSEIDACFSENTLEKILQALRASTNKLCKEAADILPKKSPTSLVVTLRALQAGKRLDFDACMRQEYRLTSRFVQGHDLMEGVRAVIIDKDQSPQWRPNTPEAVKHSDIEHYFAPLEEELV